MSGKLDGPSLGSASKLDFAPTHSGKPHVTSYIPSKYDYGQNLRASVGVWGQVLRELNSGESFLSGCGVTKY